MCGKENDCIFAIRFSARSSKGFLPRKKKKSFLKRLARMEKGCRFAAAKTIRFSAQLERDKFFERYIGREKVR